MKRWFQTSTYSKCRQRAEFKNFSKITFLWRRGEKGGIEYHSKSFRIKECEEPVFCTIFIASSSFQDRTVRNDFLIKFLQVTFPASSFPLSVEMWWNHIHFQNLLSWADQTYWEINLHGLFPNVQLLKKTLKSTFPQSLSSHLDQAGNSGRSSGISPVGSAASERSGLCWEMRGSFVNHLWRLSIRKRAKGGADFPVWWNNIFANNHLLCCARGG